MNVIWTKVRGTMARVPRWLKPLVMLIVLPFVIVVLFLGVFFTILTDMFDDLFTKEG